MYLGDIITKILWVAVDADYKAASGNTFNLDFLLWFPNLKNYQILKQ